MVGSGAATLVPIESALADGGGTIATAMVGVERP